MKKELHEINESSPLVSVIIPCYNHAHYLPTAIKSVLQQTYSPIEIIVVDDGSTDETKNVSLEYESVQYMYQENSGLSTTRNRGIQACKGDYILFLDADDWLYPHAVATNIEYFCASNILNAV